MKLYKTSRFGTIQVEDRETVIIPDGPLGFPDYTLWTFIDEERAVPFRTMQSLDNPALAFIVVDPLITKPDYQFNVTLEDLKLISDKKHLQTSTDNLEVYCIVTMDRNIHEVTLNLQGPIVINPKTKLGHQFVLVDSDYTTREKLLKTDS